MRQNFDDHVVSVLRKADTMLGTGRTLTEVLAELEISQSTYYRWRRRFDGMTAADVRRLRELERENARLRRIVADKALEIDALREISRGRW